VPAVGLNRDCSAFSFYVKNWTMKMKHLKINLNIGKSGWLKKDTICKPKCNVGLMYKISAQLESNSKHGSLINVYNCSCRTVLKKPFFVLHS